MASPGDDGLARIIQRYAGVAGSVNQREMKRFINQARTQWDPQPQKDYDPHGEGHTDAGVFARCIYELAFTRFEFPEEAGSPTCEAEEREEVILHPPVDKFVTWIDKPLQEPPSQDRLMNHLALLRAGLQQQVDEISDSRPLHVELPEDFAELMAITNGIVGAGVPSETAYLWVVHHLGISISFVPTAERASRSTATRSFARSFVGLRTHWP
jgi:hypothetical protein